MPYKIAFILILFFTSTVFAAGPYYVEKDGNDSCDGLSDAADTGDPWSSSCAFLTTQKCVDTANAGETCNIGIGTFYERINIDGAADSGSVGSVVLIKGTKSGSTYQTIIDGSNATSGWSEDTGGVGAGVWKTTDIATEPGLMMYKEGGVYKRAFYVDAGSAPLAYASDKSVVTPYESITVDWWDGVEALMYYSGGTSYFRYRDGTSAATLEVRESPLNEATIEFADSDYVTLQDLEITGGFYNIWTNTGSTNIIVDGCYIHTVSRFNVFVEDSDVIEVKNSTIEWGGGGTYESGAWSGNATTTAHGIKEHIYDVAKEGDLVSETWSPNQGTGIVSDTSTNGNFHDNTISDGLAGIIIMTGGEADITDNRIEQMSSLGVASNAYVDTNISGNTIIDCNADIRLQELDLGANDRTINIINNKIWNPDELGTGIYFHHAGDADGVNFPDIVIAHNTFAHGYKTIDASTTSRIVGGMADTVVVNNIFSMYKTGFSDQTIWDNTDFFEATDYNYMGGNFTLTGDPDFAAGGSNILADGVFVSTSSVEPNFILPEGHAARNTGVDVSATFTADSVEYTDGFSFYSPGYYTETGPNMGADQTSIVAARMNTIQAGSSTIDSGSGTIAATP